MYWVNILLVNNTNYISMPNRKKPRITFICLESERQILEKYAEQEGRTMTEILREYVRSLRTKLRER